MKVAILVKEFPPDVIGGAETQTKQMGEALNEGGHTVTVFTKKYKTTHDDSNVEYEVVRIPNLRIHPLLSDLTFLIGTIFALLYRRADFDVLQCMMIYPMGFLGYILNKLTGLPYFAWIRGNDFYVGKDVWWKRWMIRLVLKDTLVLAQSPEIQTDVKQEFPDLDPKMRVLGNAVDLPPEPRPNPTEGKILYVGRFAPKKGLNYLLGAMEILNQDCELVLVGDGGQREQLEKRSKTLDIDIEFKGFVPPSKVDRFYQKASVLVLPSVQGEGMPNVILEAMAWGVPVVATKSGGVPSLITDGWNGYTVPMRDSEKLAERLDEILEDPDLRSMLGENGRQYIKENHSWEILVTQLEEIYEELSRR